MKCTVLLKGINDQQQRRGEQVRSVSSLLYNKPMFQNCSALSIFAEDILPFLGLFRQNNSFRITIKKHCKNNICSKYLENETLEKYNIGLFRKKNLSIPPSSFDHFM